MNSGISNEEMKGENNIETNSAPILCHNMLPRKLKAVLFDVDGTLADTDVYHREVYKDLLRPYGIECTKEYYDTHLSGKANSALAKEILPQLPLEEGNAVFIRKEELFRDLARKELQPLAGLPEFLNFLSKNKILTAAVTNAPRPNVEMILEVLGLSSFSSPISSDGGHGSTGGFDTVVLGEECSAVKPDPECYLLAMKKLNVKPEECLVFEDSKSGVTAGVRAGVKTIGVLTTMKKEQMEALGAFATIKDYNNLNLDSILTMTDFIKPRSDINGLLKE